MDDLSKWAKDRDTSFRAKAAVMFALEFYKVMMGTMLTVFVPHHCVSGMADVCTLTQVFSQVKESENWTRRLAVGMNFATLVSVAVLYGFELYRENWIIEHLDVDCTKPNDNLDREIEAYPEIKHTMHFLNHHYRRTSEAVFWLVVFNFSMSGIYIYSGYSAGGATLTAMLSYLLLVMLKLYTTRTNALASVRHERAFSAYITTHRTFNVIDPDYRLPAIPQPEPEPTQHPEQIQIQIQMV
jgi:hypothetical protein